MASVMDWLTDHSGVIVTVGFFSAFTVIAIWAYLPSRRRSIQEQAMIPFKEHTHE
jgi:cbb3-type cytochrome oxidase subunit 3